MPQVAESVFEIRCDLQTLPIHENGVSECCFCRNNMIEPSYRRVRLKAQQSAGNEHSHISFLAEAQSV